MKPPSKSIGQSLRSQRVGARGPEEITVERVAGRVRKPSMIASGQGGVEPAPGWDRLKGSARVYAVPMKRHGG